MAIEFKKAQRKRAKLRIGLTGPSGSGKSWSALLIAKGLGGKTAMIDTERESGSLYADLMDFDSLALDAPYTPERYVEAIKAAEAAGYDNLIIDSTTHEWNGKGGVLELLDQVSRTKFKGNSYMAWSEMTPRHNAFIDAILQSRMHVIVTMRSKQDFVLQERGGKQVPTKVGMAPIQREGFEYELTAVLDIVMDGHFASASKDRTGLFRDPFVITEDTGKLLMKWLNSGVEPAPKPAPTPEQAAVDADNAEPAGPGEYTEANVPAWLNSQLDALERCTTKPMLAAAWALAQQACKENGISSTTHADYRLLRDTATAVSLDIERAAASKAAIDQQAGAPS